MSHFFPALNFPSNYNLTVACYRNEEEILKS